MGSPAPTRKEYIRAQRERNGRRAFGVFPAVYPREILWAFDILPVEIWDPPIEIHYARSHVQPYVCSVVKLGLELILQGKCRDVDGYLFPHTCDSLQNLGSMMNDLLGQEKPCYFLYNPKAPHAGSSRKFYLEELNRLVRQLEARFGLLDPTRLRKEVERGRTVTRLVQKLYEERAKGRVHVSNAEFYETLRKGEYLHPEDFSSLLERLLRARNGPAPGGPSIILSGILPNPFGLLEFLDQLGITVRDDDLLCCGRRLLAPPGPQEDPYEAMTERFLFMPPCTTRASSIEERKKGLMEKIQATGASGVLILGVKFCEPELFDVPQLTKELNKEDIPTLVVDVELNQGLSGQLRTRMEAFAEILGK